MKYNFDSDISKFNSQNHLFLKFLTKVYWISGDLLSKESKINSFRGYFLAYFPLHPNLPTNYDSSSLQFYVGKEKIQVSRVCPLNNLFLLNTDCNVLPNLPLFSLHSQPNYAIMVNARL